MQLKHDNETAGKTSARASRRQTMRFFTHFYLENHMHFQDYYKLKLRLGNFDDKIYNKFLKYCIEIKDHSANTVHRNVGLLKTFLYWALSGKNGQNDHHISV